MTPMSTTRALYEFQKTAVDRALAAVLRRRVVSFETGLGKSAVAVDLARQLDAKRILVATPAVVRSHWLDEFDAWWPAHPKTGSITLGRERVSGVSKKAHARREEAYASPVQVVSYALLEEIDPAPWDLVVFDEAHRLKSPMSGQSQAARAIMEANPQAAALGLTATLMPDDICDVWNPLDILWPGRFGSWKRGSKYPSWYFANRYSMPEDNGYGIKYKGINPRFAPELRHRLEQVSSRATKAEWAHLLPPFMVSTLKVPAGKSAFNSVEDWIARQGTEKLPYVLDWLDDATQTATHVCVLTHLRETAEKLGDKLRADHRVYVITGDHTPEQRNNMLAEAKSQPSAIICATMHSVGIGIDLTFCTQAIFAELYWRPETVIQALGRFSRLSGKVPSSCALLCLEGTLDEAMARTLVRKIGGINQAIQAGDSEAKALGALEEALKLSDEAAIALLNESLVNFEVEAYA